MVALFLIVVVINVVVVVVVVVFVVVVVVVVVGQDVSSITTVRPVPRPPAMRKTTARSI